MSITVRPVSVQPSSVKPGSLGAGTIKNLNNAKDILADATKALKSANGESIDKASAAQLKKNLEQAANLIKGDDTLFKTISGAINALTGNRNRCRQCKNTRSTS